MLLLHCHCSTASSRNLCGCRVAISQADRDFVAKLEAVRGALKAWGDGAQPTPDALERVIHDFRDLALSCCFIRLLSQRVLQVERIRS